MVGPDGSQSYAQAFASLPQQFEGASGVRELTCRAASHPNYILFCVTSAK